VAKEPCHIQSALANSVRVILIITLQNIRILSETLTNINQTITKEFNAFTNILESLKSPLEGTKSLRVYEEKYKAYYQSKYQKVSKHLTNDTSPNRQKIGQADFLLLESNQLCQKRLYLTKFKIFVRSIIKIKVNPSHLLKKD
jgi:hypothetical protein